MSKFSYITVLSTENYLEGVLCLIESLKNTGTKYPITVLITNNISNETEETLKKFGANIIRKNKIDIPESIKAKNDKGIFSHWTNTFDKLAIFELTEFDKLVYVDSDMLIRNNIDELFEKGSVSATIDRPTGPYKIDNTEARLTSGLMVIEPKEGILNEFMNILLDIENKRESVGDQDILQEYDKDWDKKEELHLDFKYNMFFSHIDFYTHYANYDLMDISVVHFILNRKPFYFKESEKEEYIEFIEDGKRKTYNKFKDSYPCDYVALGNEDERIVLDEYFKILNLVRSKI